MATKNLYEEVRDMRQRAQAAHADIVEVRKQLKVAETQIIGLYGQLLALEQAAYCKYQDELEVERNG